MPCIGKFDQTLTRALKKFEPDLPALCLVHQCVWRLVVQVDGALVGLWLALLVLQMYTCM